MQASQFPLPFDAQGNLILTGIHAPDGSWSLDANGSLTVHDVTLTATPDQTAMTIHGSDVDPELYSNKAKGMIAVVALTNSTGNLLSTGNICGRIAISGFDPNRSYRIGCHLHLDVQATTPTFVGYHIRYAWDRDATVTDPILADHQEGGRAASSTDFFWPSANVFDIADLTGTGTDLHFLVDVFASVAGIRVQAESWNKLWVEDAGYAMPHQTYDLSVAGGGGTTTKIKTYNAIDEASFQDDGTNRGSLDNGHPTQGYYSSTNGNQFSCITFPYSTIQADLAGATITKTEVYLNNLHWYNNSGGTAVIGTHTFGTVTGNANYASSVTPNINQSSFTYGQAKWVTVNNSIGNAFKNNTAKGIALGKGPSTSHTYYGYFAGPGQSGPPQLRITYDS